MTDTPLEIIKPQYMTQGSAIYYTVPAGTTTMIKSIRVVNNTDTDAELMLRLGSFVAGKTILPTIDLKAGRTLVINDLIFLEYGNSHYLYGYSEYESTLEISAHGVQFT